MPYTKAVESLTQSENLLNLVYLAGGFLVTEQIGSQVVDTVGGAVGFELPDETAGIVTAGAFYGYGDMVFEQPTADMMAMGSLVHSLDQFSDRNAVRGVLDNLVIR